MNKLEKAKELRDDFQRLDIWGKYQLSEVMVLCTEHIEELLNEVLKELRQGKVVVPKNET